MQLWGNEKTLFGLTSTQLFFFAFPATIYKLSLKIEYCSWSKWIKWMVKWRSPIYLKPLWKNNIWRIVHIKIGILQCFGMDDSCNVIWFRYWWTTILQILHLQIKIDKYILSLTFNDSKAYFFITNSQIVLEKFRMILFLFFTIKSSLHTIK